MQTKERSWPWAALTATGLMLSQPVSANIVGNDTQNFNPVAGRTAFVTVHSSDVLEPGRFHLGIFLNTAVNTTPYRDGTSGQNRGRINDTLTGLDLNAAYGLIRNLELGLNLPFVVHQTIRNDETRGEFKERGNTGGRLALKWRFLEKGPFGLATIGTITAPRTSDDPYSGVGSGPTYNLEVAGDYTLGQLKLGANLGYRIRTPGERVEGSLVEPLRNQMLGSLAAAFDVTSQGTLIGELYGSKPTGGGENETDRSEGNAESLVGWRQKLGEGLHAHGGLGSEWMQGLSTPDWRIYVGLVSEFGARASNHQEAKNKKRRQPVVAAYANNAAYDKGSALEDSGEKPDEVFILHNINFEFDSATRVLPGAFQELDKLAAHLKERPYTKIIVEGHTDFFGTDAYNDDLSTRRAQTVRRHLIKKHGMDSSRITSIGYGERRPMTDDQSDAGRQLNRRVELKVYRD